MVRFLILFIWLLSLLPACEFAGETGPPGVFTYTLDAQTSEILAQLDMENLAPGTIKFGQNFIGLYVPQKFLPYEPFVLGLATESPIPSVLYLDAPWVQRYAATNWLAELDRTGVFDANRLVPAVAKAFSVKITGPAGKVNEELMAAPNSIKGNILFFRQDLLDRYNKTPPRTWEELKAICREILPREKSVKYGLLFHVTNFINDFYPIFWGFGGRIHDDSGELVFLQPEMLAKAEAALTEIWSMQGTLVPGSGALPAFAAPMSLRQAFLRGECLFMINWNTRLQDLQVMLNSPEWQGRAAIRSLTQVGVGPIPSQSGRPLKFSNVGSFGWAINRFSVTNLNVMANARLFINLVNSDQVQILRAENAGEVPALRNALTQVQNPNVRLVYNSIFASPEVVLQSRPKSRQLNNILEKHFLAALTGRTTPAAAIQAAAEELKQNLPLD